MANARGADRNSPSPLDHALVLTCGWSSGKCPSHRRRVMLELGSHLSHPIGVVDNSPDELTIPVDGSASYSAPDSSGILAKPCGFWG